MATNTPPGKLQYSQNVTFHCHTCYTLTGSESTSSHADGTWSNSNTMSIGMYSIKSDYILKYINFE